ncbi:MAG: hypothetical protein ACLQJR_31630 [Stellaceae bacterium]
MEELTRRSRTARRATLLASTAIIALLGACQGPSAGSGADASSTAPAASSSGDYPRGGFGVSW